MAFIAPLVVLLSMTWKPLWTLNVGTPILLESVPVDPRDILYGDYVSLQFAVEEVQAKDMDPALLKELSTESYGKMVVYAVLQQEDKNKYGLKMVTAEKPDSGVFLKGRMYYYGQSPYDPQTTYYANFLPDRFYVPENTGKRLEDLSREGQLIAKIKVHNGYAVLQDIVQK